MLAEFFSILLELNMADIVGGLLRVILDPLYGKGFMKSHQQLQKLVGVTAMGGGILFAALFIPWLLISAISLAQPQDKVPVSEKETAPDVYSSYMGAASCNGSACHGNSAPRAKLQIGQNEFFVWLQKDRHSKAYEVLTELDSKQIAKNLNIDKPEKSHRCLVCHALDTDESREGKNFDLTEGVGCEACHGAAEQWLGPHIRKDWDTKKAATYGMYNTKDLARRSDKCLTCHLGVGQDIVDHELIGAGHPRLKFEMDNFSHVMPSHWLPPKDKSSRDWLGTKAWAINQAVAFRKQIQLILSSHKNKMSIMPDFVHFDCYACHHDVVDHLGQLTDEEKLLQRWRTKDYGGKPGRLLWNASSHAVLRHIVNQVSPDQSKAFEQQVKAFQDALTGKRTAEGFETTLKNLIDFSDQLVGRISQLAFTQQNVLSLMRSISGDGRTFSNMGFLSAEQSVMAQSSLYDAYTDAVGALPEGNAIKQVIDALYKDVKDGRSFHATQFESDMNKLHGYYFISRGTAPSS